ncbi:MAG: 50S ribosomal protein L25 [Candidatus Dadabacteria bacterium]|nr:MAG: 50S ribosomal protein L25 [Candidatus Dadabacteria bacterium]
MYKVGTHVLEIELREGTGKGAANRVRHSGLLPGIVYSRNIDSIPISVSYKDFVRCAETSRPSQVFSVKSSAPELNGKSVIVKDVQLNYVKGRPVHVDFQLLSDQEKVRIDVPLEIQGEAFGVKNEGGVMTVSTREVTVQCFPKDIPEIVTIDVTNLRLGQRIKTGDLQLPEGVELYGNPEETIVSVLTSRASKTAEGEGAEEEAAAGEDQEDKAAGDDKKSEDKAAGD